jgi:hypothetical protein
VPSPTWALKLSKKCGIPLENLLAPDLEKAS